MIEDHAAHDDSPARFAAALTARYGNRVLAIVLYGSYLRGKRDTVLDFYVLLDDYAALGSPMAAAANRVLPPNVYHLRDGDRAAKYATLTLDHFEHAIRHDFHTYLWARFAQPVAVLYARDEAVRARLDASLRVATRRLIEATVPMLDLPFRTAALWRSAFNLSYACELRSEGGDKGGELAAAYATHLDLMTRTLAADTGLGAQCDGQWHPVLAPAQRRRCARAWRWRRRLGKALSVARLFKAAFTFNEPLDYILWKVERHSGVRVEASPLQRRHPLLFAWPVLWRLYRRGGFR